MNAIKVHGGGFAEFQSVNLDDFEELADFHIHLTSRYPSLTQVLHVEIVYRNPVEPGELLRLFFWSVSNLHFPEPISAGISTYPLRIHSLQETYQVSEYRVADSEARNFHFQCEDFSWVIVRAQ